MCQNEGRGQSPLRIAARNGNPDLVRILPEEDGAR